MPVVCFFENLDFVCLLMFNFQIHFQQVEHQNLSEIIHFIGAPLNFPGTLSNDHLWVSGTHYIKNPTSLIQYSIS